jgi:sec-independent protein translocase protein TatC
MTKDKRMHELTSMSLGDHLEELRARLILIILGVVVGLIVCLFFGRFFVNLLIVPFAKAIDSPDVIRELQTIQPAEGFLVYIKVCLFFGLLITSPWVFWHLWAFVSSGLYKHERKYIHIVTPISASLFIIGSVFFLMVIAPLAFGFFIKFNDRLALTSNWTFQSYINMVLMLTLVFGIAFQLPIAIVFAERMGLVSVEMLTKGRKFVILGLVIVAAMATPPDVISQIALALPLYALFECSIVFCRLTRKRKK